MHFHPNGFALPLPPIPPHHWCSSLYPTSVPSCVPPLLTTLFSPSLSSLLSPLSFAPLSPSCLCTQHFLGCGCDVSAVTLISSGDVSILLVLLQHQQLPLLFPSFLTQCVFTLLSYQLCTLFYPHCLTFPSLLAIFYFKCCPYLFFPTIPPSLLSCVCVCVLSLRCNRKQLHSWIVSILWVAP